MKSYRTVEGRESRVESKPNAAPLFSRPRPSTLNPRRAFTLIELLVVISIIALIAALILPVGAAAKRLAAIHNAQAEMAQLETAIDRYKSAYGFYPPDSTTVFNNGVNNIPINQLYFELLGTTNTDNSPTFQSLDDPIIQLNGAQLMIIFGVNGFMNCNKPGSGEDARVAQNFLPGLKPDRIAIFTNINVPNNPIKLLVTSVGGPAAAYKPLGGFALNPWRYSSSNPTNNPGSYDLWVQLVFGQQTNLICNWNKRRQINNPLP
jgi:prepilin-type N-terminal cleavage/methylation domain-containing protein